MHWVTDPSHEWRKSHPDGNTHCWEVPIKQAFSKQMEPSTRIKGDRSVHHKGDVQAGICGSLLGL